MTADGGCVVIHFTSQILLGKPTAHQLLLSLSVCPIVHALVSDFVLVPIELKS